MDNQNTLFLSQYERILESPNKYYDKCSAYAHTSDEVLKAEDLGYSSEKIFFAFSQNENTEDIFTKCRFVSSSLDELESINKIASKNHIDGVLKKVGLVLVPDGFDNGAAQGFRIKDLFDLSKEIKKLNFISVRGCVFNGNVSGLFGKELGAYFRACYESAKKMTVILPCAMPYICVGNCLSQIELNKKEHPDTLNDCLNIAEIVAKQNETAFYAKLYIS